MQIDRMFFPVKTLGYGNRLGIWTIGCKRRCQNCANPELWREDLTKDIPISTIIDCIYKIKGELDGITITGGEPFYQVIELSQLLSELHKLGIRDILLYTGYLLKDLTALGGEYSNALSKIDVLIDGEYKDEKNNNIGIIGSSNQKVHCLNPKFSQRYENFDKCKRIQQAVIIDNKITIIGISPRQFKKTNPD